MCSFLPLTMRSARVLISFPDFFSDLSLPPPFMSVSPLNAFILVFCNFVIILIPLSDGISLLSIQRDF